MQYSCYIDVNCWSPDEMDWSVKTCYKWGVSSWTYLYMQISRLLELFHASEGDSNVKMIILKVFSLVEDLLWYWTHLDSLTVVIFCFSYSFFYKQLIPAGRQFALIFELRCSNCELSYFVSSLNFVTHQSVIVFLLVLDHCNLCWKIHWVGS